MSLIDPALLEILRCPVCHTDLSEDADASVLRCDQAHEYPVADGIVNMVPPGAEVDA